MIDIQAKSFIIDKFSKDSRINRLTVLFLVKARGGSVLSLVLADLNFVFFLPEVGDVGGDIVLLKLLVWLFCGFRD